MSDETINRYLPLSLSERDRLRRALEFICLVEEKTQPAMFEAVWEEALERLDSKYCEQCGVGLLLGKINHSCLIATCPIRKRLVLPS